MLVSADWILPVSRPPIHDGAVLVDGDRIAAVGTRTQLEAAYPHAAREHFSGCVITPGLVNAHTHLSLTAMESLIPSMVFHEWLPRLVTAMSSWHAEDFSASTALGAQRCLAAGVTAVGDIAYGSEPSRAAADVGVGGVFFWEVLGIPHEQLLSYLRERDFPSPPETEPDTRIRCGVSPHSSYASGPGLLRATRLFAREHGLPFSLHVAESPAESQLLRDGTGPLAPVAERLATGFKPPMRGPIGYLDRLGVLEGAVAVHCCQALPADIPRLAATVSGVVLCPRSNAYLHNGNPPVERLARAHVPLGIGTDSSASNVDLDLFAEMRALAAVAPVLTPDQLLEIATRGGARVLGIDGQFGCLEPGHQGDLAVFRIPATDDPVAAVVADAGCATLHAVLAAGTWRIRDAAPTYETAETERAVTAATRRAEEALERS